MDRGGKENGRNAFFSFLRSPKWPFISRPPPSPPPPLPLYSYAHSIRAFRGNALASISSTTLATDLVKRTNNDWTNERTDERTDGWMDGWTDGISQGPFCTTFSCFFFGWTSDELVRGSRRGRTEGKRSEKEERTEARPWRWRKGRREREGFFNQRILIDLQLSGVTAAT